MTQSSSPGWPDAGNPFRDSPTASTAALPPKRPGMFVAVCIIAIILGTLGIFTGLGAVAGLLINQQMRTLVGTGNEENPAAEFQNRFQEKVDEINRRYQGVNIGMLLVHFPVALGLLVGGILALRLAPAGRRVLLAVFALAVVYELVRTAVTGVIQMEIYGAITEMGLAAQQQAGPEGAGTRMFMAIMRMSAIGGMVVSVVLALVKAAYYAFSLFYLRCQTVRTLFAVP